MSKLAKLILLFSLTFLISLILVTLFKFLSLRVDWIKNLPPRPETTLTLLISAAHWSLSLVLFSSIILALNYAVRRECFSIMAIVCVMSLSFIFCFGISFLLEHWKGVPPAQVSGIPLGDRGLILTNELNKNETAVVLLNGITEPNGPRVTAIPGQPLVYQQSVSSSFSLPDVPFGDDTPWFLKSISIDIRLNAEVFQQKFNQGFFSYLMYVGSLIFLLCSIAYTVRFSAWPLANLFLAALAFRGVLAINTLFNRPEMIDTIDSFLNGIVPINIALPLFFLGFGILVNIYTLLSFAAKRRDDYD
ncbi:MAG: hypothetical protein FWD24_00090 [Treponema sp.]|nr:hypothetical protein [Treponema sp.]